MTKFHPAEVVGYSTLGVGRSAGSQKFNILVSQFTNVDGSEAQLRVGDIGCNQVYEAFSYSGTGFQPGADTIQLFNNEGQVSIALSYASAGFIEENNLGGPAEPGWYESGACAQGDFSQPMDDRYVPYGQGYVVKAGDGNGVIPSLTFAGSVKKGVTEVPGQNFCFGGICVPKDGLKVGDITCNQNYEAFSYSGTGFQPGSDTIQFFDAEGKFDVAMSYATAGFIEENNLGGPAEPGWYEAGACAQGDYSEPLGGREIAAGEGFVYKTGNGNGVWPTITIPQVLPNE